MVSTLALASMLAFDLAAAVRTRQIYEYPPGRRQAPENIAVRSNGELVFTSTSEPCIYSINARDKCPEPTQLHCFENSTATTGIVQTSHDVFTFGKGTFQGFYGQLGSFSVWNIDFNAHPKPHTSLVAAVPDVATLNGITALPHERAILAADSRLGKVWKIDLDTGKYSVAMEDPHFLPSATFPLGLNGIRFDEETGETYFSNSANGTFGVAEYDSRSGKFSPFRVIAHSDAGGMFDDFALSKSRPVAYVTEHSNRIITIDLRTGEKELVLEGPSGSVEPFEPTSAVFGQDEDVLYVVGSQYVSPSGNETFNGQIFEVDVCSAKRGHRVNWVA